MEMTISQQFAHSALNSIIKKASQVVVDDNFTIEVHCTDYDAMITFETEYEEVDGFLSVSINKCIVSIFNDEFTMSDDSMVGFCLPESINHEYQEQYNCINNDFESNDYDLGERF